MATLKPFGQKAHSFIMREPALDKKYTLLVGSVRSSKTFSIDAKVILKLCRYKVEGKRVICGASKQTVYKNMLLDIFASVGKRNYSYNHATGELWLFRRRWFVIGAKDEASYRNILGMTIGVAVCDELTTFPRSFTMQLFMRMSPAGARLVSSLNPDNPYHYLKAEVIDNPAMQPDLEVIHFTLDDNPNINAEARRQIEASQTGVYYQRYVLGKWVVAEGAIYGSCFSDAVLFNDETRPVYLLGSGGFVDRWIAVDCGVDHPQVYLEFYDDGRTVWVTREWVWVSRETLQQLTDAQYADRLQEFMGDTRMLVLVPPECLSFRNELEQRGIFVQDADNSVADGIRVVSSLMAQGKLRIHENCTRLRKCLATYAWDPNASKRGEEAPIKVNDDEADCLRYGIFTKIPAWRVTAAS